MQSYILVLPVLERFDVIYNDTICLFTYLLNNRHRSLRDRVIVCTDRWCVVRKRIKRLEQHASVRSSLVGPNQFIVCLLNACANTSIPTNLARLQYSASARMPCGSFALSGSVWKHLLRCSDSSTPGGGGGASTVRLADGMSD